MDAHHCVGVVGCLEGRSFVDVEDGDCYPPKFLGVLLGGHRAARDGTTWDTQHASRAVEILD